MTNKILFIAAGIVAFSITGIGVASALANSDGVQKVGAEVSARVSSAVTTLSDTVEQTTGIRLTTHESDSGESDGDSEPLDVNVNQSAASSTQMRAHDSGDDREGGDDENENENEGDGDRGEHSRGSRGGAGTTITQPTTTPPPSTSAKTFTLADVATHNTVASCYTAINSSVYDLTAWITQHPGGSAAIKSLCGIDGSAAFNGQHGGQARPASELAGFKIGSLVQ